MWKMFLWRCVCCCKSIWWVQADVLHQSHLLSGRTNGTTIQNRALSSYWRFSKAPIFPNGFQSRFLVGKNPTLSARWRQVFLIQLKCMLASTFNSSSDEVRLLSHIGYVMNKTVSIIYAQWIVFRCNEKSINGWETDSPDLKVVQARWRCINVLRD